MALKLPADCGELPKKGLCPELVRSTWRMYLVISVGQTFQPQTSAHVSLDHRGLTGISVTLLSRELPPVLPPPVNIDMTTSQVPLNESFQ